MAIASQRRKFCALGDGEPPLRPLGGPLLVQDIGWLAPELPCPLLVLMVLPTLQNVHAAALDILL